MVHKVEELGSRVAKEAEIIHLFERETEHLCLRQPIHGIERDPFARE